MSYAPVYLSIFFSDGSIYLTSPVVPCVVTIIISYNSFKGNVPYKMTKYRTYVCHVTAYVCHVTGYMYTLVHSTPQMSKTVAL